MTSLPYCSEVWKFCKKYYISNKSMNICIKNTIFFEFTLTKWSYLYILIWILLFLNHIWFLLLERSNVNSKYCHMCNSVYTPLFQIKKNCLRILCLRLCYFNLFLFIRIVGINISINIKSLTTWFRIRRSSKLFSPFYVLHHPKNYA